MVVLQIIVFLLGLLIAFNVYGKVTQIYPHIYPLWGIAFVLFFDYTDSQELSIAEHML
jgi:hypothetical protein